MQKSKFFGVGLSLALLLLLSTPFVYKQNAPIEKISLMQPAQGTATCLDTCSVAPTSTKVSHCNYTFYYDQASTPQSGTIYCTENQTIYTYFNKGANKLEKGVTGTSITSPATQVNKTNYKMVPELLICPLSFQQDENPENESYFYTNTSQYPFVAGDACLNHMTKLETNISLPLTIYLNGPNAADYASVGNMKLNHTAELFIRVLGYSPMVEDGSLNYTSNGFSSNSYVFKQVPSFAQHAIWTWSAPFVNFSNAKMPASLEVKITPLFNIDYNNSSFGWSTSGERDSKLEIGLLKKKMPIQYYNCTYNYRYDVNLTLDNINNTFIPFNEITNTISMSSAVFNTTVLPSFLMSYQIPSPGGATLGNSYDIFDPLNYYTPANTEDMFPLDTLGLFYFTYNGVLVSVPENSITNVNNFTKAIQQINNNKKITAHHYNGNFFKVISRIMQKANMPNPFITNATLITAIPNDYIFVVNESNNGNYYLNVLRIVPKGYFNATTLPPNIANTSNAQSWEREWDSYWPNLTDLQNETTYVINQIQLPVTPFNISANDAGTVFIAGESGGEGALVAIFDAITPGAAQMVENTTYTQTTSVPLITEIAAPPAGDLLFGANDSYGYIYEFNVSPSDITYYGNMSLSFGATEPTLGINVLVNITDYLEHGGLYGVDIPIMGSGDQLNPSTDFDNASFHHPLSIQDVNGYLYVLDEWTGTLGSTQTSPFAFKINFGPIHWSYGYAPVAKYNILMLRVLNSSGYNVPINPTLFNDIWQRKMCTPIDLTTGLAAKASQLITTTTGSTPQSPSDIGCQPANACKLTLVSETSTYGSSSGSSHSGTPSVSIATWACEANATKTKVFYSLSSVSFGETWPPYGWPLSANITTNSKSYTFCSSPKCNYNPKNLPADYKGGYAPIGPAISSVIGVPNMSMSINYNDTVNIIMNATQQPSSLWSTIASWFGLGGSKSYFPYYKEMIVAAKLNVQNYTQLFKGAPPYICYVNTTQNAGVCNYFPLLNYTSGPIYTVTNPFRYVENVGNSQLLTFVGALNSIATSQAWGATIYKKGPPSLRIQYATVPYGQTDIITGSVNNEDVLKLSINGNVVESAVGSIDYAICATPSTCVQPGENIPVQIEDVNTSQTTSANINVLIAPEISLQSPYIWISESKCTPSKDIATATAYNPSDTVTIDFDSPQGTALLTNQSTGKVTLNLTSICSELTPSTEPYKVYAEEDGNLSNVSVFISTQQAAATSYEGTPLNTSISGSLRVPFAYKYTLKQKYTLGNPVKVTITYWNGNVVTETNNPSCNPPDYLYQNTFLPGSSTSSSVIYSENITTNSSNTFSAIIENGATYLTDVHSTSLYIPSLSSVIIPPNLFYTIQNNRLFGYAYVNMTKCSKTTQSNGEILINCENNMQKMLNYTRQLEYSTVQYTQNGYPAFEAIEPLPINPVETGNGPAFSYLPQYSPRELTLFDFYEETTRYSKLLLNLSKDYLGFNMFNFIFNDRFNNTIYVPLAADIANTTEITLNVTPNVSTTNLNQTTINVSGHLYALTGLLGTPKPIANQYVYLYYGRDINYVAFNSLQNPTNASLCTYAVPVLSNATQGTGIYMPANVPSNCTLSNPMWIGLQQNANTTTYAPDFNASGSCNPPANSLLAQNYVKCNIFNDTTCPNTALGNPQYCVAISSNGTGICTPQLGLFAIAKTNAEGYFSANVVACGGGSALGNVQIIAKYYGYPVQPANAILLPLTLEANNTPPSPSVMSKAVEVMEQNYYYAPNTSYASTQIGMFQLSFGATSPLIALALLLLFTAFYYFRHLKNRKKISL